MIMKENGGNQLARRDGAFKTSGWESKLMKIIHWVGHVLRHNCVQETIIEVKLR